MRSLQILPLFFRWSLVTSSPTRITVAGRAPRQCPSWWPCASTGQWQFGVDERGEGRLNCR